MYMLHEDYSECSPLQLPWPLLANEEYDQFCSDQLKTVFVSTPQDRQNILHHLTYTAGKCHWGRCIILKQGELSRVVDYDLHHGDALLPSPEVQDIGKFEQLSLPFVANFWSAKLDEKGRLQQFCRRPNPLMAPQLGTTPSDIFQCDLLHSFQLGPLQRWVTGSLWRIALHNPWGITGSSLHKMEIIGMRLRKSLFAWCKENSIDHAYRLFDFTMGMLGTAGDARDCHRCSASLDGNG